MSDDNVANIEPMAPIEQEALPKVQQDQSAKGPATPVFPARPTTPSKDGESSRQSSPDSKKRQYESGESSDEELLIRKSSRKTKDRKKKFQKGSSDKSSRKRSADEREKKSPKKNKPELYPGYNYPYPGALSQQVPNAGAYPPYPGHFPQTQGPANPGFASNEFLMAATVARLEAKVDCVSREITDVSNKVNHVESYMKMVFNEVRTAIQEKDKLTNEIWASNGALKSTLVELRAKNDKQNEVIKNVTEGAENLLARLAGGLSHVHSFQKAPWMPPNIFENSAKRSSTSHPLKPAAGGYAEPEGPSATMPVSPPKIRKLLTTPPRPPPMAPPLQPLPSLILEKCEYCNDSHCSTDCESVKTWKERMDFLMENKRCTRCLQPLTPGSNEHSDCPKANTACTSCGRDHYGKSTQHLSIHHPSICTKRKRTENSRGGVKNRGGRGGHHPRGGYNHRGGSYHN